VLDKMHGSIAQAIFYGRHATTLELGGGEGIHDFLHRVSKLVLIIPKPVLAVVGDFT
jgi:hypothetical protein